MYTDREDRSRISIVGSYALIGKCPSVTLAPTVWTGCKINKRGFEQYKANWTTSRGRYTGEAGNKPVHGD
jgi:hypothetical protein